ncbi:MAG: hypothetical protein GW925_00810, partial [Candidatus Pacebacteria bacterium]|nr:hypothetical protein [Candidatus Paceibacterota bacterium]
MLFGSVLGTVFLLVTTGLFAHFQSKVLIISTPVVQKNAEIISVLTVPLRSVFSGVKKEEKIQNLSLEVSSLQARVAALEYVESENKALRALLENSDRTLSEVHITTPIVSLAYPAVSVGSLDGIQQNRAVVLSGTLIGIITEVFPEQSRVTLLSQSQLKPVLVRTESGVEGVVVGDGRSVLMKHIPREIEITEGERVFTLGQEGIRKNMFVGKIGRVTADPSAPTKVAVIQQYVSFYD